MALSYHSIGVVSRGFDKFSMTFTPFETTRLRLRPQEARDAGFALCIWGDPITGKYLSDPDGIKTVLADVAAENAGSCSVMCALGFTPTENGTFRRSGSQTEYKNLTFKKQL